MTEGKVKWSKEGKRERERERGREIKRNRENEKVGKGKLGGGWSPNVDAEIVIGPGGFGAHILIPPLLLINTRVIVSPSPYVLMCPLPMDSFTTETGSSERLNKK